MSNVELPDGPPAAGLAVGPPLADLLMEFPRSLWDMQRTFWLAPLLKLAPEGDGHPILIMPGFLASDVSTAPIRSFLRALGYPAYRWRLGRNVGPTADVVHGLRWSIERLSDMHERPITVIGWSLGGIMAREIGRIAPDRVRQVISLGSPFALEHPSQTRVGNTPDRFSARHHDDFTAENYKPSRDPLPVPSTAIYTRNDGIVAWHTCVQQTNKHSENIEVGGSHVGLGHHPAVLLAVSDRVAQPEGEWRHFRPPALLRHWYPTPVKG